MPHLTRRFTLLRAPDGSMVTPDAMRAHLRAQRARARATGVPGANFLTEDEENEIINQMRQDSRYASSSSQTGFADDIHGFGGTDGFGGGIASYASSSPLTRASADRIGSLTESLGDLSTIAASTSSGSLFSGRSSERDTAYLMRLDRSRVNGGDLSKEAIDEEEEPEELDSGEADLPGAFEDSFRRTSKMQQQQQQLDDVNTASPSDEPDQQPRSRASRPTQSQLLTSLSPEAFRRVSMALEEVIGLVAPNRQAASDAHDELQDSYSYEYDAVSASEEDSAPSSGRLHSSTGHGGGEITRQQRAMYDDDAVEQLATRDESSSMQHRAREAGGASPESDAASFRSANEEAFGGTPEMPNLARLGLPSQASQGTITHLPYLNSSSTLGALSNQDGTGANPPMEGQDLDFEKTPVVDQERTPAPAQIQQFQSLVDASEQPPLAQGKSSIPRSTNHSSSDAASLSQQDLPRLPSSRGGSTPASPSASPPRLRSRGPPMTPSGDAFYDPRSRSNSRSASRTNTQDDYRQGRPLSPNESSVNAPVLSANAIAARSRQYFPPIAATTTPDQYASGFRASPAPWGRDRGYSNSSIQAPVDAMAASAALASAMQPVSDEIESRGGSPERRFKMHSQRQQGSDERFGPALPVVGQRLRASSTSNTIHSNASEGDDDGNDIWATVASDIPTPGSRWARPKRSASASDHRPPSSMPTSDAVNQLDGAGMTVDQLAAIQENLVRSASHKQALNGNRQHDALPPLPRSSSQTSHGQASREAASRARSASIDSTARIEKAREKARQIAGRAMSPDGSYDPTLHLRSLEQGRRSGTTTPDRYSAVNTQSPDRQGMVHSSSMRSVRSQVQYDVTTSHRPTSPPPRQMSRDHSLPSLQDLSSRYQPMPQLPASPLEQEATKVPEAIDVSDEQAIAEHVIDYEAYQEQDEETLDQPQQDQSLSHDSGLALVSRDGLAAPSASLMPQRVDSSTGGHRFETSSNLHADVAAQAKEATEALKGSSEAGGRLAPRRSKVLAKKKTRKNPGSVISVPRLISTSQQLQHTQPIATPEETASSSAGARRSPVRQVSDYGRDPKTAPATLIHRTRSSSFGNTGRLEGSPAAAAGDFDKSLPMPTRPILNADLGSYQSSQHSGQRTPSGDASNRSPRLPGTPSSGKAGPGSLTRLMSRMKMRRPSESSMSQLAAQQSLGSIEPFTGGISPSPSRNEVLKPGSSPIASRGASPFGLPSTYNAQVDPGLPDTPSSAGQNLDNMPFIMPRSTSRSAMRRTSHTSPTNEQGVVTANAKGEGKQLGSPAPISEKPAFDNSTPAADVSFGSSGLDDGTDVEQTKTPTMDLPAKMNSRNGQVPSTPLTVSRSFQSPPNSASISQDPERKSARDTIIRRTLIFPNDPSFTEDKRRSFASSINARRRSRRHVDDAEEANATYQALLNPSGGNAAASNEARSPEPQGRQSYSPGNGAPRSPSGVSQVLSLRPPSPNGSTNRRASSGAQSSYAGSLYDMYIRDGEMDSEDDGYPTQHGNLFPPSRNHIEVTERADGSIVWQVVAGLGEGTGSTDGSNVRDSRYTGHSRVNSDVSQLSFSFSPNVGSPDNTSVAGGGERTFTGMLKEDDSRSFFAKHRSPKKSFSQDCKGMPPLPVLPPLTQTWVQANLSQERLHNSAGSSQPEASRSSVSSPAKQDQLQEQQQRAFDVSTADAGITRVVYSNDGELEALLEALASQTDAAKFHFDPKDQSSAATEMKARDQRSSQQSSSKASTMSSSAAEGARRRVEDEIMSVLNASGATVTGLGLIRESQDHSTMISVPDLKTLPAAGEQAQNKQDSTMLGLALGANDVDPDVSTNVSSANAAYPDVSSSMPPDSVADPGEATRPIFNASGSAPPPIAKTTEPQTPPKLAGIPALNQVSPPTPQSKSSSSSLAKSNPPSSGGGSSSMPRSTSGGSTLSMRKQQLAGLGIR